VCSERRVGTMPQVKKERGQPVLHEVSRRARSIMRAVRAGRTEDRER